MNRASLFPTTAAALVLLAACAGEAAGGADLGGVGGPARALLEADRAFAAASAERGAEAWADAWAADGLMVRDDGRLVRGPAAVREAMVPLLQRFRASFRWEPTEAAILWPDSLGYTIGRWWIESETGDPGPAGHYLTAWVRRDGAWRVALDAPLSACPDAPGARAFDFWLGAWDVDQRIRAGDAFERYSATDRVSPTRHGCVVVEEWRGTVRFPWAGMREPRTLHGASLRLFDPGSGDWTIFWIDDLSGAFGRPFIGRFEGRTGDFFQDPAREGASARRIRFRDDGATVDWELALRTGPEDWTPIWTMRFRPRRAPPRVRGHCPACRPATILGCALFDTTCPSPEARRALARPHRPSLGLPSLPPRRPVGGAEPGRTEPRLDPHRVGHVGRAARLRAHR